MVMREALEGYNKGFQLRGRLINNLRYADDVILIATSEGDFKRFSQVLYKMQVKELGC